VSDKIETDVNKAKMAGFRMNFYCINIANIGLVGPPVIKFYKTKVVAADAMIQSATVLIGSRSTFPLIT